MPTRILPSRTPRPTATPQPTPRGTKAKLTASLPASVPCVKSGTNCKWVYTVAFSETNCIAFTIERIRRRFVTVTGATYTVAGGDGWFNTTISIKAYSTNGYYSSHTGQSSLYGQGSIIINYTGHDEHGNAISGEVRTIMAKED